MPFQKGHKLSVGNSGGKNWHTRLNDVIEKKKEEIKQEAITELADKVVARKLLEQYEEETNKTSDVKEIALPVYLKSKADKIDHTTKGEKITGFNFLTNETNNKTNTETRKGLEEADGQDN